MYSPKICMHVACMRSQSQNRRFVTGINISAHLNVLLARFASSTPNATPTALQAALGSVCARQHTRLFLFRKTIHRILTCTPLYWSPKTCTEPTRSPSILLVITTIQRFYSLSFLLFVCPLTLQIVVANLLKSFAKICNPTFPIFVHQQIPLD